MTLEELKAAADEMGYVVRRKTTKLSKAKPCICGCEEIDDVPWFDENGYVRSFKCKCSGCGRMGPPHKTKREARRAWNLLIGNRKEKK